VGELGGLGRLLLILGLMLAGLGLFLLLAGRVPFLGRLPGDIAIQRGTWTFYLPLATSILLSLLLTLLLNLFFRR
jgi:hypothetical protein